VTSSKALAVGRFRGAVARALEEACSTVQLEFHAVESTELALRWAEEFDPHSLLVDSNSVNLEQLCLGIRTQARHALVPILSVVQKPTELAFAEIFSSGGDDVVGFRTAAGLISRLRRLPQAPWDRPPASAYRVAVIVAPERARRVVLARAIECHRRDIPCALKIYEETRRDRANAVVRGSAENAMRFHNPTLADPVAAEAYVDRAWEPEAVRRRYDWLFEHDASTTTLAPVI